MKGLGMHYYEEKDAEFSVDGGSITGTAIYEYDIEEVFDADIGGRDGREVTGCKLIEVKIGEFRLIRSDIKLITGPNVLLRLEDGVGDDIQDLIDCGEL